MSLPEFIERELETNVTAPPQGAQAYRWATMHAVRRLAYLLRGGEYEAGFVSDGETVEPPSELRPFALWRLQAVWGDLTDIERVAVRQLLSGEGFVEVARKARVYGSTLARARRTALRRMDEPRAFKRGREYQRRAISLNGIPMEAA